MGNKGKRGMVVLLSAFTCLILLILPQVFQRQVVASSSERKVKSQPVDDYFDIRVSDSIEAKAARTRAAESLAQREQAMAFETQHSSSWSR